MFRPWLNKGYDIRPTIAVTRAHIDLPEVKEAVRVGRLVPDVNILSKDGQAFITKVRQDADSARVSITGRLPHFRNACDNFSRNSRNVTRRFTPFRISSSYSVPFRGFSSVSFLVTFRRCFGH